MQELDPTSAKDVFTQHLSELFTHVVHDEDPLKAFRIKAYEHFQELGLPEKTQEGFPYVPLKTLYQEKWTLSDEQSAVDQEKIRESIFPECQRSYIAIVNGVLRLDLSDISALPKALIIQTLQDSIRTYGAFLQNRFSKMLKEETDPFVILNAAFQTGVFILIPPRQKIEAPLQILQLSTSAKAPKAFFPRVHLIVGTDSELALVASSSCESSSFAIWNNPVIDIALEEKAKCHFIALKQNQKRSYSLDALRVSLKKEAHFSGISVPEGSSLAREGYHFSLLGEHAEASFKNLMLLTGGATTHTYVLMEHLFPHTKSTQHIKSVLGKSAKASFEGKILVRKEAQKTEAYQLCNHLLLSDQALAYSRPNLEIMADDVKASHGATVSELKGDEIFYLRTRGIEEKEARRLLLAAYCNEIAGEIFLDSLRLEIVQNIAEMIEKTQESLPYAL